eukprot:2907783-Prymnesium_polylepis.1
MLGCVGGRAKARVNVRARAPTTRRATPCALRDTARLNNTRQSCNHLITRETYSSPLRWSARSWFGLLSSSRLLVSRHAPCGRRHDRREALLERSDDVVHGPGSGRRKRRHAASQRRSRRTNPLGLLTCRRRRRERAHNARLRPQLARARARAA